MKRILSITKLNFLNSKIPLYVTLGIILVQFISDLVSMAVGEKL